MTDGVVAFPKPEDCTVRKFVREMIPNPPSSVGLREEGLVL
jgi:CRISPR-associated protein Cas5d